jgi:signal transduction histidine kinase
VAVAEAALRIHQKTIEAKKIHIVKNHPESLKARVYSGEILQLVSNLVANALDALPLEGTLWLKLRKRRDQVHLVVADNGHGIPYEVVAQAFELFFTTKGDRGTGIGLSLSRKVVGHHYGEIRLRSSVRPGKSGTMFKITLPA